MSILKKGLASRIPSLTLFNSGPSTKNEEAIEERLKPEQFSLLKTVRHGFPYKPTCIAYDPLQKLLAIGTTKGCINLYGQPDVQCNVSHETKDAVQRLQFLINEGALISVCADDSIHLWNLRHRKPAIVHSLRFNSKRDSITSLCVSFQSKWIYVGTKAGNVHVINIETFQLSGYIIHWNKAIEKSQKGHPGPIYHISENPQDANKLLLGFETGLVVLWDMKSKVVDERFYCSQRSLCSVAWYSDGKQFVSSHQDGSLSVWNIRTPAKALEHFTPHGQGKSKGSDATVCSPIKKVTLVREECFLFSGGLHYGNDCKGLTIVDGKTKKLLLTKFVVDFECIKSTPWQSDEEDAIGIIVLLPQELIVYDLTSSSLTRMSTFDIPYEFSLHESPVTFTDYYGHCNASFIEDLYAIGSKQRKSNSENWPITGGTLGDSISSNSVDLIVTGHADGSLKFWDGSAGMFALMAKFPTNKYFHKRRRASRTDSSSSRESTTDEMSDDDCDFMAIHMIEFCVHSRTMTVVNAANHVFFFTYSNSERSFELEVLPIDITTEKYPDTELGLSESSDGVTDTDGNAVSQDDHEEATEGKESNGESPPQSPPSSNEVWKTKPGVGKRPPGFQAELCCICEMSGAVVPLRFVAMSSGFGIVAFGSINFLVLVDTVQNKLINVFYPSDLTVSKIPSTPSTPNTPRTPSSQSESESPGGKTKNFNGHGGRRRATRTKSRGLPPVAESDPASNEPLQQNITNVDGPTDNILCLTFAYTFTKKGEFFVGPCMWVGTSLGSVVLFAASFPPAGDQRETQPVLTFNTGLIFQHKGAVQCISVLDKDGHLFSSPSYFWSSSHKKGVTENTCTAVSSNTRSEERHFLVVCTSKEAEVHSLPSHVKFSKRDLSDHDSRAVLKSDVFSIEGNSCLACICDSGHLLAFSLPSLTPLLTTTLDFPSHRGRFLHTFKFGCDGQALYLHSPTEIQLISIFTKTSLNFPDFSGTLFSVVTVPERPNKGFFAALFNRAPSDLDRERLFGSESGKASQTLATRIPGRGTEDIQAKSGGVASQMAKNMESLKERGEKLETLETRTQQMRDHAEQYSRNTQLLAQKYKERKWYQM